MQWHELPQVEAPIDRLLVALDVNGLDHTAFRASAKNKWYVKVGSHWTTWDEKQLVAWRENGGEISHDYLFN